MSTRYLLPCECGQSVPVGTRQAGQHVTCPCGRKLAVPSLRAIRQLPVAQDEANASSRGTWSPVKGILFALGAMLLTAGIIVAGHSWWVYSQVSMIRPSSEHLDQSIAAIDGMTAAELHEVWHAAKEHGLEKQGTSVFAIWGAVAHDKFQSFVGGVAAIISGLLIIVVSIFIRGR